MASNITFNAPSTLDKALDTFRENGVSVASWAVAQGFNPALVYAVLKGQRKCLRGQSHQIAQALGLKKAATAPRAEALKAL